MRFTWFLIFIIFHYWWFKILSKSTTGSCATKNLDWWLVYQSHVNQLFLPPALTVKFLFSLTDFFPPKLYIKEMWLLKWIKIKFKLPESLSDDRSAELSIEAPGENIIKENKNQMIIDKLKSSRGQQKMSINETNFTKKKRVLIITRVDLLSGWPFHSIYFDPIIIADGLGPIFYRG